MYFGELTWPSSTARVLNFRQAHFSKILADLSNIDWVQLLDCKTVNKKWDRFKRIIRDTI
uniref:Uncharacterized protein n=1 Tax=Anguilla anguilla TaxID=7936 RepID=A0A0E9XX52_ANGAN